MRRSLNKVLSMSFACTENYFCGIRVVYAYTVTYVVQVAMLSRIRLDS